MQQRIVHCPQCGKPVIWQTSSFFRPFCCERCKLNDLAQWAQESYRVPDSRTDPEDNNSTE